MQTEILDNISGKSAFIYQVDNPILPVILRDHHPSPAVSRTYIVPAAAGDRHRRRRRGAA